MNLPQKIWTEMSALAVFFWRALFISPFNRQDSALLNLLIIAKKGKSFNLQALLEYDYALNEEVKKLRARMGERTSNFQEEVASAQARLDQLFSKARSEEVGPEDLIIFKREMELELTHLQSEWGRWRHLIEDELHSQREIGGKIKEAWYALTPHDPEDYGDAAQVVENVIREREKLKTGWMRLKNEQDLFFQKCQEMSEKHEEINAAWRDISHHQKAIKEERDRLRQSWEDLKREQEDYVARFQNVERDYQKIDEAWKELSYQQQSASKVEKLKIPKARDLSLSLQEENLKREYFEKQAGQYMGDITASLKEPLKIDDSGLMDVDSVLAQILDVTAKGHYLIAGEHPFKLPERQGTGTLPLFFYQQNVYLLWKWLRDQSEAELVVATKSEDPLFVRTLDFIASKGLKVVHFPHQVALIKRSES